MAGVKSDSIQIGAVILVPDPDPPERRDNEEMSPFVPMLPLDGTTVIKREIHTLRRAGINLVLVLCGSSSWKQLKPHLSHHGVIFLNSVPQQNLEPQAIAQAAQYCDRVILIPVDCPAFLPETISRLSQETESAAAVCDGVCSHFFVSPCSENFQSTSAVPPRLASSFMEEKGNSSLSRPRVKVEVHDRGVLLSVTEQGLAETEQYVRTLRNANPLFMKTKLVIGKEHDFFGPGLYHLLCQVQETGSIQAAAANMGMSYSKCWKLLNRAEEEMGFPFLERYNGGKNGGSSRVTQEGRLFLERYHAMDEDLKRISRHFFDVYFKDFQ